MGKGGIAFGVSHVRNFFSLFFFLFAVIKMGELVIKCYMSKESSQVFEKEDQTSR